MTERLNVGVIGLGRLGRVYAEDLARYVPAAKLVAVADARAGVAETFGREYCVPKMYASHSDLLSDRDVEAVAVITPTSTHKEVVVEAARCARQSSARNRFRFQLSRLSRCSMPSAARVFSSRWDFNADLIRDISRQERRSMQG